MSTWRDQPAEHQTLDWIRGWTVARFRHRDRRLWAEQEPGYRELERQWHQDGNHGSSGYEWDAAVDLHGLIPDRDRVRYMEEGRDMQATDLVGLMAGVAVVKSSEPAAPQFLDEIPIPF